MTFEKRIKLSNIYTSKYFIHLSARVNNKSKTYVTGSITFIQIETERDNDIVEGKDTRFYSSIFLNFFTNPEVIGPRSRTERNESPSQVPKELPTSTIKLNQL